MTDVSPDPKPEAPHKDPELLKQIHEAWNAFGCALCGYRPSSAAQAGARIEVHHIVSRAQGGEDSWDNTVGLCGELAPQKCHWRVTTNRVSLAWLTETEPALLVWTDHVTHEEGICRELTREAQSVQADLQGGRPLTGPPVHARRLPVAPELLPEVIRLQGEGPEAAAERFSICQQLVHRVESDLLLLSLLLQDVAATREWSLLGYDSVRSYGEAAGISPPTMSKLRKIAKIFEGKWMELPASDRRELSLDKLYYAGKLLEAGAYHDSTAALHEAVARPQRDLWAEYREKREEGKDTDLHECPDCGQMHLVKAD